MIQIEQDDSNLLVFPVSVFEGTLCIFHPQINVTNQKLANAQEDTGSYTILSLEQS